MENVLSCIYWGKEYFNLINVLHSFIILDYFEISTTVDMLGEGAQL